MRTDGFVMLSRSILDWRWYKNPNTMRLFLHLLLCANYTDGEFETHIIKRGQLVTGRKILSKELNLSEREIRTALDHLKTTNDIAIKSTAQYSIITILNYEKFASATKQATNDRPTTDQQSTSERPTTDQQSTNERPQYNKYNKNNKYNKYNKHRYTDSKNDMYTLSDEEIEAFKSKSLYTD